MTWARVLSIFKGLEIGAKSTEYSVESGLFEKIGKLEGFAVKQALVAQLQGGDHQQGHKR